MEEAISDLDAGTIFYNSRVDTLGRYFFDSLMADIESLGFFAGIHAKIYGYFCLLAKRFPYAIY